MEIFKSPNRPTTQTDPEVSDYVDYTPRRIAMAAAISQQDVPNSITYARQRRSYFYQQLAGAGEADNSYSEKVEYMDSPAVRRHFSINEKAVDVEKLSSLQGRKEFKSKSEWTIDDFIVGRNLGTGKFGTVYLAIEKSSGQIVALKILKKRELEEATVVPFLKREIEIQGHLNHPNITRLYGYFHNKNNIYLVLEYAGDSDLYTCLEKHKVLSEAKAAKYVLEIADALAYMHKLGVFHRDIKLENILVSRDGRLKIADFGWAVYDPKPRRNTFCGTLDYLPPEMIQRRTHNASVDIWALGIVCYELLVGKPPFENQRGAKDDHEETYRRIIEAEVVFPDHISIGAQNFILKLLQRDPSSRIKVSDIQSDPWIRSFTSVN